MSDTVFMKKVKMLTASLICFVICVGAVFSAALVRIYDTAYMTQEFLARAVPAGHDGISREDFGEIASEITRFLRSGKDYPVLRGETIFSDRENLHLSDCSKLTRAMGSIRTAAIVLCLGLLLYAFLSRSETARRERLLFLLRAMALGAGIFTVCAAALSIYGLIDFDSLFLTFHRICFRNDLWLLDPAKDLLIQLMPYSFFTDYASALMRTLWPVLLIIFCIPIASILISRKERKEST